MLVFSSSKTLLKLCAEGVEAAFLDGTLKVRRHDVCSADNQKQERERYFADFNKDDGEGFILYVVIQIGGVGLNFQGCHYGIFMEPNFNPQVGAWFLLMSYFPNFEKKKNLIIICSGILLPQVEIQARDRMYRLGQCSPVTIWKLISLGTVEERIRDMQREKLESAELLFQRSFLECDSITTQMVAISKNYFIERIGFQSLIKEDYCSYLDSEYITHPQVQDGDGIMDIIVNSTGGVTVQNL